MADEQDVSRNDHHKRKGMKDNPTSSAIYGMGVLGALAYFIIHATSFWGVVLGILKAVAWPAVLVYKLLEILNM